MHAPRRLRQFRAALQEDHFSIHKRRVACAGDVPQQRVPCAADVVGHAVLGQRDVFGPGGRPTRFAEIQRPTRPKHVLLPFQCPVHVRLQPLVIPHRHVLRKFLRRQARFQCVVATKSRALASTQQRLQHAGLSLTRTLHMLSHAANRPLRQRDAQCSFPTHGAKIAQSPAGFDGTIGQKQQGTAPLLGSSALLHALMAMNYFTVIFLVLRRPSAIKV